MVSYVFAAVLITFGSITVAILDEILQAESAFLPTRWNRYLFSKSRSHRQIRQCRFWRRVLTRLILALADQQLVTGFALILTGWILYYGDLYSAHFALVVYLSCLSSSSHLAAMITLRGYFRANPLLAAVRVIVVNIFAIFMAASFSISITPTKPRGINYLFCFIIGWIFWAATFQILPDRFSNGKKAFSNMVTKAHALEEHGRSIPRLLAFSYAALRYIIAHSPCTMFVMQIAFAALSLSLTLAQKFSSGGEEGEKCSLNTREENKMGYGQILAIFMLALPAIATFETYKGEDEVYPSNSRFLLTAP